VKYEAPNLDMPGGLFGQPVLDGFSSEKEIDRGTAAHDLPSQTLHPWREIS